jgi:hypothetical protein
LPLFTNVLEGEFCELRLYVVLRSSQGLAPLWMDRCRSRLLSGRTLLQDPPVAVRIAEKNERVPAPAPSLDPRAICPVYNLANLHAPLDQFGPGSFGAPVFLGPFETDLHQTPTRPPPILPYF